MSPKSVILITLLFTTVSVYFGHSYTKFHMSKESWLVVTIATGAIFTLNYIIEIFTKKKED